MWGVAGRGEMALDEARRGAAPIHVRLQGQGTRKFCATSWRTMLAPALCLVNMWTRARQEAQHNTPGWPVSQGLSLVSCRSPTAMIGTFRLAAAFSARILSETACAVCRVRRSGDTMMSSAICVRRKRSTGQSLQKRKLPAPGGKISSRKCRCQQDLVWLVMA